MNPWRDGRDGLLGTRLFDDATAEELIAGRTAAGTDDLGRVSAFLEELRSLGEGPVPPPSAALSKMLSEAPGPRAERWLQLVDDDVVAAREPFTWDGARPRNAGQPGPRAARRRPTAVVAMAAAVALAATVGATGAAARILPRPLQAVARAIETVTPFELRTSDDDADEAMSRQGAPFHPGSPDQAAAPPTPSGVPDAPAASGAPSAGAEWADDRFLQSPAAPAGGGKAPRQAPPASGERKDDVAGSPSPTDGATTGPTPPPPPPAGPAPPEPSPTPPRGGRTYTALLTGKAGPGTAGDPDGSGSAVVSVHPGRWLVCVTLTTSGVDIPTSVHLHEASAPSTDPIIVGPAPAGEGSPHCVAPGKEVVRSINTGRGDHYVEVHNAEFPDGALRGRLSP